MDGTIISSSHGGCHVTSGNSFDKLFMRSNRFNHEFDLGWSGPCPVHRTIIIDSKPTGHFIHQLFIILRHNQRMLHTRMRYMAR
ncbi:putative carboxylesterase [Trifolium repens]|nr:putative carboxylesterase [Trifolium repens]